jgi:hypothetical protein
MRVASLIIEKGCFAIVVVVTDRHSNNPIWQKKAKKR